MNGLSSPRLRAVSLLLLSLLLALLTVHLQVRILGLGYVEGKQLARHMAVLNGTADSPWVYRVLSEYLVEGWLRLLRMLHAPHPVATAFVSFRILQNTLIFLLAYGYLRALRLPPALAAVGLMLLGYAFTHAYYDSDLQFNTYFDLIFYLAAGRVALIHDPRWLLPLAFLGGLNRETSGLIPLLLLPRVLEAESWPAARRLLLTAGACLALYAAAVVGLRLGIGERPPFLPHGVRPGLPLLHYNFGHPATWVRLLATVNVLPVLALAAYRRWPFALKTFFWILVPIWLPLHFLLGVVAETRLFLVPLALVFVPGALFFAWASLGLASGAPGPSRARQ